MIISVVIDPEAFNTTYFTMPGYRENVEMLLRGLEDNGFMYVDPHAIMLRRMNELISKLPMKQGQQIQIRFAELQKKIGRRVMIPGRSKCICRTDATTATMISTVCNSVNADAAIVGGDMVEHVLDEGLKKDRIVPLGEYLNSSLEAMRHRYLSYLPPIDQFSISEMEELLGKVLRPSKSVRVFDKQIGSGERITRFREGISLIVRAWQKSSPHSLSECCLEIITCKRRTHDPTEAVFRRICDRLGRRLFLDYSIPVKILLKEDDESITHDRYLQTDAFSLSFSRGLDIVQNDRRLECCTIRIEGNVDDHLRRYAGLPDALPPEYIS